MQTLNLNRTTVGKRFFIEAHIGSGSFGAVYLARDIRTGTRVSVKIENKHSEYSQLVEESRIYHKLRTSKGVPDFI